MRFACTLVILAACGGGGGGGGGGPVGTCDEHPLQTGLVAQQTGVSADAFDCEILTSSASYAEPDPMLFKAIMYQESRFDQASAGCTNLPCGMPAGWTAAESGCLGLMQIVPACGTTPNNIGLLPNGRPNMTKDTASASWPGSIFNPAINIEIGVSYLADNRMQAQQMFPGCTTDQYTMMALGNYANYGSTKSCTDVNHGYLDPLLVEYRRFATAAGYTPHGY
jgi:hypothetical protein